MQTNKFDHDEHARNKEETDFWGQVRRTVNGRPVDKEQVEQILNQIRGRLLLEKNDFLLDIGCGNAALSSFLFDEISFYVGVDFSQTLIDVANKYFFDKSKSVFFKSDAVSFLRSTDLNKKINKVMCQGSFSYMSNQDAYDVLHLLNVKFDKVTKIFLGSLPDRSLAYLFYKNNIHSTELDDHESPIGIWRTEDEFESLALSAGWNLSFHKMPKDHYTSYYRYDVLLTR